MLFFSMASLSLSLFLSSSFSFFFSFSCSCSSCSSSSSSSSSSFSSFSFPSFFLSGPCPCPCLVLVLVVVCGGCGGVIIAVLVKLLFLGELNVVLNSSLDARVVSLFPALKRREGQACCQVSCKVTHFPKLRGRSSEIIGFPAIVLLHLYKPELQKALSVLMLYAPVFIFTSGSSALLGCPRCGLSM